MKGGLAQWGEAKSGAERAAAAASKDQLVRGRGGSARPRGWGGGLLACGPDLPAHAAARRVGVGGGAGWRGGGGPVCVGGLMARVMAAIAVWRLRMTTPAGRRRAGVARRAGRRRDRPGVR